MITAGIPGNSRRMQRVRRAALYLRVSMCRGPKPQVTAAYLDWKAGTRGEGSLQPHFSSGKTGPENDSAQASIMRRSMMGQQNGIAYALFLTGVRFSSRKSLFVKPMAGISFRPTHYPNLTTGIRSPEQMRLPSRPCKRVENLVQFQISIVIAETIPFEYMPPSVYGKA